MLYIKNMNILDNKIYHNSSLVTYRDRIETFEYGILSYEKLFTIIRYNVNFPKYVINNIEVLYRYKDLGLTTNNVYYRFKKPIMSKSKQDFYHIPYYSNYLINEDGDLYNITKRIIHKYHKVKRDKNDKKNRKNGYYITRAINDTITRRHISRHRLIALAFITIPESNVRYIVNHKNGIPGDDRISNLEWVTYSENLRHAIKNNLMPNSVVPIDVKNIITGEVWHHPTISEATKKHMVNIYARLKHNQRRYVDGLVVKRRDDKWPILNKNVFSMGVKLPIRAVHIATNKTLKADSIMEMSLITNVSTTAISDACKKNKATRGYLFRYDCPIV